MHQMGARLDRIGSSLHYLLLVIMYLLWIFLQICHIRKKYTLQCQEDLKTYLGMYLTWVRMSGILLPS